MHDRAKVNAALDAFEEALFTIDSWMDDDCMACEAPKKSAYGSCENPECLTVQGRKLIAAARAENS